MATIKSYTDIEQSKKLAEILPIDSADMRFCFSHTLNGRIIGHYPMIGREPSMGTIPCWSLAALFSALPEGTNISTSNTLDEIRYSCWNDYDIIYASNVVDACYEMIINLKEKNLL